MNWTTHMRGRRAFTLVELLVVILVVAILIAVALPSFLGQTHKAQDSAAEQQLSVTNTEIAAVWTSNGQSGFPALGATQTSSGSLLAALHASEPQLNFDAGPGASLTDGQIEVWYPSSDNQVAACAQSSSGNVLCFVNQQDGELSWTAAPAQDESFGVSAANADTTASSAYVTATSQAAGECAAAAIAQGEKTANACTSYRGEFSASASGWPAASSTSSSTTTATSPTAPAVGSAPTVSTASPTAGQPVTAAFSFYGTPSPTTSVQWYDCPSATSTPPVGCSDATGTGATSASYTPTVQDAGSYLTALATASNGTQPSASAYTTPEWVTSSYPQAVLADNPVAYWRLGNPSGTCTPANSASSSVGSLSGTSCVSAPGALSDSADSAATSLAFSGTGMYAAAGSASPLDFSGAFTLEAWVKFNSVSGTQAIVERWDVNTNSNGDGGYIFGIYGGTLQGCILTASTSNQCASASSTLKANTWYLLDFTVASSGLKLYVDGTQSGATVVPSAMESPSGDNFVIGAEGYGNPPYTSRALSGDLEELAAYGSALPASGVCLHYEMATGETSCQ